MKGYLGTLLQVASWCLERSYLELGHTENPFMKRGSDLELPLGFDRHILGWEWWGIEFWFDSQSILWISNWKWCLIGMPFAICLKRPLFHPFWCGKFPWGWRCGFFQRSFACSMMFFVFRTDSERDLQFTYLGISGISLSLSLRWLCFPAPDFLAALQ